METVFLGNGEKKNDRKWGNLMKTKIAFVWVGAVVFGGLLGSSAFLQRHSHKKSIVPLGTPLIQIRRSGDLFESFTAAYKATCSICGREGLLVEDKEAFAKLNFPKGEFTDFKEAYTYMGNEVMHFVICSSHSDPEIKEFMKQAGIDSLHIVARKEHSKWCK